VRVCGEGVSNCPRSVRRIIVDDEYVKVGELQIGELINEKGQAVPLIVGRDYHHDSWGDFGQYSSLRLLMCGS
jgi:hypothetical protein